MSLLLCHECYSWVEPWDGRCPECHNGIDLSAADPPLPDLHATIGDIVCLVGEARVRRKMLPEYGTVYATTNGLCFLPHESVEVTQLVEGGAAGSSLLLNLAALFWAPLMFLLPFMKSRELQETQVQMLRPRHLTPSESVLVPELLMQDPGAFFVPRRSIRSVRSRGSKWIIDRIQGGPIKLTAASDRPLFQHRMREVFDF